MRTTLTLDPDVAQRIEQEVRRKGKTLKTVVNEALRAGLGLKQEIRGPKPFRVEPHDFGFNPGIDLDKMNQLVDELEAFEGSRRSRDRAPGGALHDGR
jgi:hypothetical protein